MKKQKNERESWKYCSRCLLAKEVNCSGRSLNCDVEPITEDLLSELIFRGGPEVSLDYMKEHTIIIRYYVPGEEPHIYVMSKEPPTKKDFEKANKLGMGYLVHDSEFKAVKEKVDKMLLEDEIEKSTGFAG